MGLWVVCVFFGSSPRGIVFPRGSVPSKKMIPRYPFSAREECFTKKNGYDGEDYGGVSQRFFASSRVDLHDHAVYIIPTGIIIVVLETADSSSRRTRINYSLASEADDP